MPLDLVNTIQRVHNGEQAIPVELALDLAGRISDSELSAREVEVLRLVDNGNANKRIASLLEVRVDTIKAHMKAILGKLGASDRTHAVTLALRRGVIDLSD